MERYDSLLEIVKERRSNRKFKSDPIPEGYIEKIIEVARWAPSGFHTQPWEFVAVTRKDIRDRIVAVLDRKSPPILNPNAADDASHASFRDAPVFIFALCDWRAYVGLPGKMERDNPRVASLFCSSMAGAFLYMHLAATALGLSSQWYSGAGRQGVEEEIRAIIGFPEHLTIYDLMILGYPAVSPVPKEVRALRDIIHYNECGKGDFRSDEQVVAEAAITRAWCLSAH
ncbi:MAG: nitroreductase family protein [Deltaproteobacteria bacterium]|nr:nitroreductase family protein [Deltaproteobacteria bacterium]